MTAENTQTDPDVIRLACIEEAIEKGFEPDDQWADWLKAGVKDAKAGKKVDTEWLQEFDRFNSYI